jgi:hypothetical protein
MLRNNEVVLVASGQQLPKAHQTIREQIGAGVLEVLALVRRLLTLAPFRTQHGHLGKRVRISQRQVQY